MKKVVLIIFSALISGMVFTSCSSNVELGTDKTFVEKNEESEWWQPILLKHNLKLGAYNNFDNVFTMGMEGNSINNGICTLKVATALIKNKDGYILIEADCIHYNINESIFDVFSGVVKTYTTMDSDKDSPSTTGKATQMRLFGFGKSISD